MLQKLIISKLVQFCSVSTQKRRSARSRGSLGSSRSSLTILEYTTILRQGKKSAIFRSSHIVLMNNADFCLLCIFQVERIMEAFSRYCHNLLKILAWQAISSSTTKIQNTGLASLRISCIIILGARIECEPVVQEDASLNTDFLASTSPVFWLIPLQAYGAQRELAANCIDTVLLYLLLQFKSNCSSTCGDIPE